MTVTLELRPDVEKRLTERAAARGISLEAYLMDLIESLLPTQPEELSLEEFEAALDEMAEGSDNLPVLPPEAFTREYIYGDHD